MAKIIPLRRTAEIGCSACGATVDAACDCGAPYLPAGHRAAEAIAANPQMSDRAIAREIGVSTPTVSRARPTVTDVTVERETRIGVDGRRRRMPIRIVEQDDEIEAATPKERHASFMIFSNEAMLLAKYDGPIDDEVLTAARATASAWCRLVETMEQQK